MIPEFYADGNLPSGLYAATLEEVIERFEGKNLKRRKLTRSLKQFCLFIRDHSDEVYLFGSYITTKPAPRDVDLLIVFPKTFNWTGHDAEDLLHYQQFETFHLHLNICRYEQRDYRRYMLREMGLSRDFPQKNKGFIRLEL